jgi:L-threonylcarbamoyladenylate synthase
MQTEVIKVDPGNFDPERLRQAAAILRTGGLVALPTETVYGLGAVYNNGPALAEIFRAKGRPADNPLIVHIYRFEQLELLAEEIEPKLQLLMEQFWPGPLTLVFPKKAAVSSLVTAGLSTVAVRMPAHPVAAALLRLTGLPVAAPSANLSGKPSPTRGSHVLRDFEGKIPLVIDAGPCEAGIESTVAMLNRGKLLILRPGSVTREMLETVLHEEVQTAAGESGRPQAPGMKYRHYAPNAPVILVEGAKNRVLAKINALLDETGEEQKAAVIGASENLDQYRSRWRLDLGPEADLEQAAARLYELLRQCDDLGVDRIFIEAPSGDGIGAALKNRLYKAAGGSVIHVT